MEPVARARWSFCLLLGALSTFTPEVLSGSSPWVLVFPPAFLLTFPVYALHVLVLGTLLVRARRTDRWTLVTAGLLFGLYEAWMTKVLFNPWWTPAWGTPAGIAVFELFWISFCYHVVMSFVLPLLVAIEFVAPVPRPESPSRLHGRFPRFTLVFFLAATALYPAFAPSAVPFQAVWSFGANLVVLAGVFALYGRMAARAGHPPLEQLLPTPRGWWILVLLLLGLYAFYYVLLRPEALPGPGPQLLMLGLDGLVIGLLYLRVRSSTARVSVSAPLATAAPVRSRFSWRLFGKVAAALVGAGAVGETLELLVPGVGVVAIVLALVGVFAGAWAFGGAVWSTWKEQRQRAVQPPPVPGAAAP